jgi:hypothetical protein
VLTAQLDARIESTLRGADFTELLGELQSGNTDLAQAGARLLSRVLSG